ncbi:MAG: hypothetical protein FWC45_05670 [Treponema sp.]|nr:hypothetical protein [Treponema sp.]
MSDAVLTQKLAVSDTIKEGIDIGMKNIGPILVNVVLWVVTIWIPYLNLGTTIGLSAGIIAKASRGEAISMTEIFDKKYRKYMGEFLLTSGLVSLGVGVALVFFIVPGIVIGLAWSLAILLVVDKGKNPTDAITQSNNCTYGYKWRMFGIYFLVSVVFTVVQIILLSIGTAAHISGFMGFIVFLSLLFELFVFVGLQASVYKQLTQGV